MATAYRGSLRYKRKAEICEIAEALELHPNPSAMKREQIEDLVRSHLLHNRDWYAESETFRGLIESLDQEQRRRRSLRSSSINANLDSDASDSPEVSTTKTPRKHSQRASTSSLLATPSPASASPTISTSAAAAAAADLSQSIKQSGVKAKQSLESLVETVADSAQSAADPIIANPRVQEARADADVAVRQARKSLRRRYRDAKKTCYRLYVDARSWLSDSRHLVLVLLTVEAAALVLSALPTTLVEVGSRGPTIPIIHPNKGINDYLPHWALALPHPKGLVSLAFWTPVLLWTLYAVLIPGAIAHLITFDRASHPSALSFLLARVSSLVLLTRIVPGSVASLTPPAVVELATASDLAGASAARGPLSYGHVLDHLGHDIQLWASTTVLGFALYEGIASRPRSV
ncbi:hypothetical protein ACQY0O_001265 [Thecaphora frezii]